MPLQKPQVAEIAATIVTQGTTSAASRVKLEALDIAGNVIQRPLTLRVRICNSGVFANSTNATVAVANGSTLAESLTSNKDIVVKSSQGVQATGTLTFTSTGAKHLETVTIGSRVYVFDALGTLTPATNQVMVDISGDVDIAQGTLTIAEPITAGDTMTIGSKNYQFVAHGTANADGEISLGADEAASKVNIVAAILGTDGINTANPDVTCAAAFSSDDLVISSKIGGTLGNTIVTTETFTHVSNVFDAGVLGTTTAGADPTVTETAVALKEAINDDSGAMGSATNASGVLTFTADQIGADFNSVATTETCATGAWGAATLAGGTDNHQAAVYVDVTDATAETVTLRPGPAPVSGMAVDCDGAEINITHAA